MRVNGQHLNQHLICLNAPN